MSKRKVLTVDERLRVIELSKSTSARQIAFQLGVGKTQIQSIILKKKTMLNEYLSSPMNGSMKRRMRVLHTDIDRLCVKWFHDTMKCGIPIIGSRIQVQALKFAADLQIDNFKASNGWLESFLKRNNLSLQYSISGIKETNPKRRHIGHEVIDCERKFRALCIGYDDKNIFSIGESGLFLRHDSIDSAYEAEHITVALCASMTGEKLMPLIIGKSAESQAIQNVNIQALPVSYQENHNAWMTSDLMTSWLSKLNALMKTQERYILIFLANSSSHLHLTFSNINLCYLPPNIAIMLPIHQGVIQSTKIKFRKLQLSYIAAQLHEQSSGSKTASDILKNIRVAQAINWFSSAWEEVKPATIQQSFAKSGFCCKNVSEIDTAVDAVPQMVQDLCQELYKCDLQNSAHLETNLSTHASKFIDWNQSAAIILENISDVPVHASDEEVGGDEEVDDKTMNDASTSAISSGQAICYLDELVKFGLANGDTKFSSLVFKARNAMDDIILSKGVPFSKPVEL